MRNNDAELIRRTLAGDETAFTMLVKKYRKHVHTLAWHKIGDFHIAEDITQETFLQVYRDLATLREPDRFPGWLYVVTNHRCIAWFRKNQLHVRLVEGINMAMKGEAAYSRYVADEQAKTATEAQQKVVKQLLAKLQESERTVMTLYYFGEMTCEEISKFLGVSVNTIKSRLSRARQRLKKEEPIIRETLDSFQLSAHLTENIVREIAHIKPLVPSRGKPLVPWAIAVSTVTVILLMIGVGNQYLLHFQHPYSFEAESEHTIEIVDASIVLNIDSKPDVRSQAGRTLSNSNDNNTGSRTSETLLTSTTGEDFVMNQTNIELCTQNLIAIGKAIEIYQKAHDDFPEWLSDLHPKYIPDANILICPADTSGGKAGYPLNVDPKMSVSYGYEFHPEYRTYKSRQRLVYGDDMPLVRCRHHANNDFQCLNLSLSSKIYESTNVWESIPQDMYGSHETAITTLEETLKKHPDNVDFYELYPLLVNLYIEVENEPAVDTLIERFKSVMKPNIADYITLCNMLNAIGRYEDMLSVVKSAEHQNPGNIFIPTLFAYTYQKLGNTELAKSYERNAYPLHELIGKFAPNFSAIDLNGHSITLHDYRGKVVLLNFWATWYSPGLMEIPHFKKVYDTHKDEGFDIIGISLDYDEPKLRDYIKENNIPWRQILDNVAGKNLIARQYAIRGIPATYLIDREGKLITHKVEWIDLEKLVAEAVKNKSKD